MGESRGATGPTSHRNSLSNVNQARDTGPESFDELSDLFAPFDAAVAPSEPRKNVKEQEQTPLLCWSLAPLPPSGRARSLFADTGIERYGPRRNPPPGAENIWGSNAATVFAVAPESSRRDISPFDAARPALRDFSSALTRGFSCRTPGMRGRG